MDANFDQSHHDSRKIIIELSNRSREIIRLFEELQRKRQQADRAAAPKDCLQLKCRNYAQGQFGTVRGLNCRFAVAVTME
jgi:hypothetical protein